MKHCFNLNQKTMVGLRLYKLCVDNFYDENLIPYKENEVGFDFSFLCNLKKKKNHAIIVDLIILKMSANPKIE